MCEKEFCKNTTGASPRKFLWGTMQILDFYPGQYSDLREDSTKTE